MNRKAAEVAGFVGASAIVGFMLLVCLLALGVNR